MQRKQNYKARRGFVTIAVNSESIDYLRLAYLQALSIKATQKNNLCAVIVDHATYLTIEQKHRDLFDYIIEAEETDIAGGFRYEWQVYWLTPFKETIKLEADVLLTRSIDHWWDSFALRDICLSHGTLNFRGNKISNRSQRKLFDDNHLPDLYNGLMYFGTGETAHAFFILAEQIFKNWEILQQEALQNCRDSTPTTDVVYALAASIIGDELCHIPTLDFINFVHMKAILQGWPGSMPWMEQVMTEVDGTMIRINNLNQYFPVHYHEKEFATARLIKHYESLRA